MAGLRRRATARVARTGCWGRAALQPIKASLRLMQECFCKKKNSGLGGKIPRFLRLGLCGPHFWLWRYWQGRFLSDVAVFGVWRGGFFMLITQPDSAWISPAGRKLLILSNEKYLSLPIRCGGRHYENTEVTCRDCDTHCDARSRGPVGCRCWGKHGM